MILHEVFKEGQKMKVPPSPHIHVHTPWKKLESRPRVLW